MTEHTPVHPSIVVLLSRVMESVGAVSKAERANMGAGGSYNFRGVDTVVKAVSPALRQHGVVVVPELLSVEYGTAPTARGGVTNVVHVQVRYTFHGPAGDSISTSVAAESFDNGDKATAKAMSVALRTAMLPALMLPTDEEDPDRVTYERAAQPAREPQRERPPALPPTPGAQRAQAAAAQNVAPLPPAVADQYRDRVLQAAVDYAPGDDRDNVLRTISGELASMGGAGQATLVEVPEPWRNGKPPQAPLTALIGLARKSPNPNDPWSA